MSSLTSPVTAFIVGSVLLPGPVTVSAQEGINNDWEGTFSAVMSERPRTADTIKVREYEMNWIQHNSPGRSVCTGSFAGREVETGTEFKTDPVEWTCSGGKEAPMLVDFDINGDFWSLTPGTGSPGRHIIFHRVGRKIWQEDLLPRAVQPPPAVADSVVRLVRALYERVNTYSCSNRTYAIPWPFIVCARADTIGRVITEEHFEAFHRRLEFTYDAGGRLRFALERVLTEDRSYRYYFDNRALVRVLVQGDTLRNGIWNPSQAKWNSAEADMLGTAAKCLTVARMPFDSVAADTTRLDFCELTPDR